MAKLRKFVAYRKLERPYTRKSKFKKKDFIKGDPGSSVVRYDMGNLKKQFPWMLQLIAEEDLQIRHNAIESARKSCNRLLEVGIGVSSFHLKIRMYPHHILRENPLASGAGADRMSTGMKQAFGKPIGVAAQVKKGKVMFEVTTEKAHVPTAKQALRRAKNKLPCSCKIVAFQVGK